MSRRKTELAVRQPGQQQPHVDEIELRLWQLVHQHVMRPHLDTRMRQRFEHRGVEVGRDDGALGSDARGQPGRYRATAGADLQAPPAAPDTAPLEVLDRSRIE